MQIEYLQAAVGATISPLAGKPGTADFLLSGVTYYHSGGVVGTTDGGATWVDLSSGLPITGPSGGYVQAIATDPSAPSAVYIAEWHSASNAGVFASANRGTSWSELGHLAPRVSGPDGLVLSVATQTLHAATDTGVYEFTLGGPPPSK